MIDAISKLTEFFPNLGIITNIILVVFLILGISDDFDKIKAFIKKIFDFRNHIDKLIYSKRRTEYNKTLYSEEYMEWQYKVLKKVYESLIEKANGELFLKNETIHLDFTKIDFENSKDEPMYFESVTLKIDPIDFPFTNVCKKEELERKEDISEEKYKDIQNAHKGSVRRYYRLIKQTIRYPKRLGYMLEDICLEDQSGKFSLLAYSGNYENNLKTSHILEYELYHLFLKNKVFGWNIEEKSRKDILKKLPIRNAIHGYFTNNGENEENEYKVLLSGKGRSSLLGVQIFVVIKNHQGKYDTLRIRRSVEVAAKPGFLQFIPSGGFEAMNDCVDFDAQWDNYSITKAVFRELLEECFGQDEDDKKAAGNNVSPDKIYGNKYIKEIIKKLEDREDGSQMQLLGTSMSLVGLRHELSFILKIDDPEMSTAFIANYESKTAIHMIDINWLEKQEFWMENDLKKLNCTSAGLFELARSSEIYQKCLNKNQS